jgi:hypothetical protein
LNTGGYAVTGGALRTFQFALTSFAFVISFRIFFIRTGILELSDVERKQFGKL